MIVIFDGPRASGKTEHVACLMGKLSDLGVRNVVYKFERPEDPFAQMMQAITKFEEEPKTVHILDRFSMTEYVFSTWLERIPHGYLVERIRAINKRLSNVKAIHAILMADLPVMAQRITERPEHRGWDMPMDTVRPMWFASLPMAPDILLLPSNTREDLNANVTRILSMPQILSLISVSTMDNFPHRKGTNGC